MRKKIVAGNWKMNLSLSEANQLVSTVLESNMALDEQTQVIFGVPLPYVSTIAAQLGNHRNYHVAAQNCSEHLQGAYTGEVSAGMIGSCGAEYIIVGHSERRQYYGDSHEIIRAKVDHILQHNMQPVFCCGETLQQRQQLKLFNVVESQLWDSLFHLDENDLLKCIIAYEPVWAIGTGLTASAEQAQEMHVYIRSLIEDKFGVHIAASISIVYGGSCNDKNAAELFALSDVDGGLIGGASLKAESFCSIIRAIISK